MFWRGGPEPIAEVLWDNQSWEAAERELSTIGWPDVDGYMSLRLLVVLRGPSQTEARVIEQVDRAIELHPDFTDDETYRAALEREMPSRDAQLTTTFMHIAFGRALLHRLFPVPTSVFSDDVVWHDPGQDDEYARLSDQPHYRAGVRAARLVEFETLHRIGSCAAEFRALDSARRGASADGIEPDAEWFASGQFSPAIVPRPS